jgi:hypothetical protein
MPKKDSERFLDDTHRPASRAQLLAMCVRLLRNAGATNYQVKKFRARVTHAPTPEAAYEIMAEVYDRSAFPEPRKDDPDA